MTMEECINKYGITDEGDIVNEDDLEDISDIPKEVSGNADSI